MIVLYNASVSHPVVRVGDLLWHLQEDVWTPAPPLAPDIPVRTGVFHPLPPAAGEGEGILVNPSGGEALRLRADGEVAWWRQVLWPGPVDWRHWADPLGPGGWMTPEGDLLLPGMWLSPDGEVQPVRIADRPVQGVGPGRSIVLAGRRIRPLPGGGWRAGRLRHAPPVENARAIHVGLAGEVWAWPEASGGRWWIRGGPIRGESSWHLPGPVGAIRALADGRWAAIAQGPRGRAQVFWGTPGGLQGMAELSPKGGLGEIGPLRPLPGDGWLLLTSSGMIVGNSQRIGWRPLPLGWPDGTISLPGGLLVRGEAAWWALPADGLTGEDAIARVRLGIPQRVLAAGERALIIWRTLRPPAGGWGEDTDPAIRYTRWPSGEDMPPSVRAADVFPGGFWALWRGRQGKSLAGQVGDRGQPLTAFRMPPGRWKALRALPDGTALAVGLTEGAGAILLRLGAEGPRGEPLALPKEIPPEALENAVCQAGPGGIWVCPSGGGAAILLMADSLHVVWGVEKGVRGEKGA